MRLRSAHRAGSGLVGGTAGPQGHRRAKSPARPPARTMRSRLLSKHPAGSRGCLWLQGLLTGSACHQSWLRKAPRGHGVFQN